MTPAERIATALVSGRPREAAEEVIRAFGAEIGGYLERLLGSPDDADDAFSLWEVAVWRGVGSLREPAAARVWAYKVAWNAARQLRREAWGRRRVSLRSSWASRLPAEPSSRTPRRVEREASALASLRRALPVRDRSLLTLVVDRGFTFAEAAEVMAEEGEPVAEATLRQRYHRLKVRLGRLARKRGLIE